MSDYKEIIYEKQRGGVLITLNRPEALNAITRPMLKEIPRRAGPGRGRSGDPRHRYHRRRARLQLRLRSGDHRAAGAAIFNGPTASRPA